MKKSIFYNSVSKSVQIFITLKKKKTCLGVLDIDIKEIRDNDNETGLKAG